MVVVAAVEIIMAIVEVETTMAIVVQEVDIVSAKMCLSIVGHTELALMIRARATTKQQGMRIMPLFKTSWEVVHAFAIDRKIKLPMETSSLI